MTIIAVLLLLKYCYILQYYCQGTFCNRDLYFVHVGVHDGF